MLRVSVTTKPDCTAIIVEGRLVVPWADELATCWRHVRETAKAPFRVDLDGVTFIDVAGKSVLRSMHADGAALEASTVMMRAFVDELRALQRRHNA